jgi:hypothetical protein
LLGLGHWSRAWSHFEPEGARLLAELKARASIARVRLRRTVPLHVDAAGPDRRPQQLMGDPLVCVLFLLKDMLTLYPGRSLVQNIGNDSSGTHLRNNRRVLRRQARSRVDCADIAVEQSDFGPGRLRRILPKPAHLAVTHPRFGEAPGDPTRMSARTLVKELAPPVFVDLYRRWSGRSLRFPTAPPTFDEAKRLSSSYAAPQILEQTLSATRAVMSGHAAFERDSILFNKPEYSFPILATLLRAGIGNPQMLEVTDFRRIARQHLPTMPALPAEHDARALARDRAGRLRRSGPTRVCDQ